MFTRFSHVKKYILICCLSFSLPLWNVWAQDSSVIVVLGDSLVAGYNIEKNQAFPAQLERALREEDHPHIKVINAGISGDTTASGLARAAWVLETHKPDYLILALGANDMLRGLNPEQTYLNLQSIIQLFQTESIPVLLATIDPPANLGLQRKSQFKAVFKKLSEDFNLIHHDTFLKDALGDPSLMLPDGIHPNPEGVAVMVERIFDDVEELVD